MLQSQALMRWFLKALVLESREALLISQSFFFRTSLATEITFQDVIMSISTFLNCRVVAVEGHPLSGVQAFCICLSRPNIVYSGYTNENGEIWDWYNYHTDDIDSARFWLRCSQGSHWRIIFDIPDHTFSSVSANLCISGDTDSHSNVTVTVAPDTIACSNGSFSDILQRNSDSPINSASESDHLRVEEPRRNSSLEGPSTLEAFH